MASLTITKNFQASIPKKLREHFGLKIGDRLLFFIHGNEVVVRPSEIELPPPKLPKEKGSSS